PAGRVGPPGRAEPGHLGVAAQRGGAPGAGPAATASGDARAGAGTRTGAVGRRACTARIAVHRRRAALRRRPLDRDGRGRDGPLRACRQDPAAPRAHDAARALDHRGDDAMAEYGTDRPDGGDDARPDAELAAAGAELPPSAPPGAGTEVIAHVLRRDVARARRANVLLAAAAAIAVVAMVPLAARSSGPVRGSGGAESAAGGGGPTPAEQIVAELPDEPVDPREVQLVASVSRYDTCDSLLEQLHRVGAAHVGSRGFG